MRLLRVLVLLGLVFGLVVASAASPAQAAQSAVPDGDVANPGSWSEGVPTSDADSSLFNELIDLGGSDDASTFDKTADMREGDANKAFIVSLSSVNDPNSSIAHTIVVRARKNQSGGVSMNLIVTLQRPDGSAIASFTTSALDETWNDYDYTLTEGEADSIAPADYSNLQLKVDADPSTGGTTNGRHPEVSTLELALPEGGALNSPLPDPIYEFCKLNPNQCTAVVGDLTDPLPPPPPAPDEPADLEPGLGATAEISPYVVLDNWNWRYESKVFPYWACINDTNHCRKVGEVKVWARIHLNGRQSQWKQTSTAWSGPAIKAAHAYNCVDDNGGWPNSSCSGGWRHLWNDNYQTAPWTRPNPDYIYHEDWSTYWYDFHWHWHARGWSGWTWRFPQSGNKTSAKFLCDRGWGECRF